MTTVNVRISRWVIAGLILALVLLLINTITSLFVLRTLQEAVIVDVEPSDKPVMDPTSQKKQLHTKLVLKKFKVDQTLATQVVTYAHKYQRDYFPRAEDILAIVAIESSFNPKAKSSLEYDPAIGLTQIRPKVWNIKKEELNDIESQIRFGADILSQYYQQLKKKEAAIEAYNIGITAYLRGDTNPQYVNKYRAAVKEYRVDKI